MFVKLDPASTTKEINLSVKCAIRCESSVYHNSICAVAKRLSGPESEAACWLKCCIILSFGLCFIVLGSSYYFNNINNLHSPRAVAFLTLSCRVASVLRWCYSSVNEGWYAVVPEIITIFINKSVLSAADMAGRRGELMSEYSDLILWSRQIVALWRHTVRDEARRAK